jgi:hypothetical protein
MKPSQAAQAGPVSTAVMRSNQSHMTNTRMTTLKSSKTLSSAAGSGLRCATVGLISGLAATRAVMIDVLGTRTDDAVFAPHRPHHLRGRRHGDEGAVGHWAVIMPDEHATIWGNDEIDLPAGGTFYS